MSDDRIRKISISTLKHLHCRKVFGVHILVLTSQFIESSPINPVQFIYLSHVKERKLNIDST